MMTHEDRDTAIALVGAYQPTAIYYEEADIVEYVRADVPSMHRRVDEFLTLVLDLERREPIGFTLKGFRNYYLKHRHLLGEEAEFLLLTTVLEEAVKHVGARVFEDYLTARSIAESDRVTLRELPTAA